MSPIILFKTYLSSAVEECCVTFQAGIFVVTMAVDVATCFQLRASCGVDFASEVI